MNLNPEQFPTYKFLFPVQTTQTTSHARSSNRAWLTGGPSHRPNGSLLDERAIEELRERSNGTPYDKEYVRRDGTRVSVWLCLTKLPGPEELIAAFVLDITERKRMEEELKQSEERSRMVVESSPDAIFVRSESGHFVYVNHASVSLFGATSADQLIGQHIMERIRSDERSVIAERMKRLNGGGMPFRQLRTDFFTDG